MIKKFGKSKIVEVIKGDEDEKITVKIKKGSKLVIKKRKKK